MSEERSAVASLPAAGGAAQQDDLLGVPHPLPQVRANCLRQARITRDVQVMGVVEVKGDLAAVSPGLHEAVAVDVFASECNVSLVPITHHSPLRSRPLAMCTAQLRASRPANAVTYPWNTTPGLSHHRSAV